QEIRPARQRGWDGNGGVAAGGCCGCERRYRATTHQEDAAGGLRVRGGQVVARGRSCRSRIADVLHGVGDGECATRGYGAGRITYSGFDEIRTAHCDLRGRSLAVVALVGFWFHYGDVW